MGLDGCCRGVGGWVRLILGWRWRWPFFLRAFTSWSGGSRFAVSLCGLSMMRERNVGSFVQAVDEVRSPLAAEHIAVVPVRRLGKIVKLFSRCNYRG